MKAWSIAAAVLSIATVGLVLPESASPVSSAAACDEGDLQCVDDCWQSGDDACLRGCLYYVGCKNIRIEH